MLNSGSYEWIGNRIRYKKNCAVKGIPDNLEYRNYLEINIIFDNSHLICVQSKILKAYAFVIHILNILFGTIILKNCQGEYC